MSETVTLTAPVYVSSGTTMFRVWDLDLRRGHPDRAAGILAIFREVDGTGTFVSGGKSLEARYDGAEADALLITLNKANLSTLSLEKRVIQKCQTDGRLGAGAMSGSPD